MTTASPQAELSKVESAAHDRKRWGRGVLVAGTVLALTLGAVASQVAPDVVLQGLYAHPDKLSDALDSFKIALRPDNLQAASQALETAVRAAWGVPAAVAGFLSVEGPVVLAYLGLRSESGAMGQKGRNKVASEHSPDKVRSQM